LGEEEDDVDSDRVG